MRGPRKIVNIHDNGTGYKYVTLRRGKKSYNRYVHILVLEAFIGKCPKGMEVAHADGVKANCCLENLSYKTTKDNNHERRKHGTNNLGLKGGRAKLSVLIVTTYRIGRNLGLKFFHRNLGINESNACSIYKFETWNPAAWIRDIKAMIDYNPKDRKELRLMIQEAKILLASNNHPNQKVLNKMLYSLERKILKT